MTKEEIIEVIKGLSVLELNELVKACEEEFGVSAAAGVVVAAAGAGGDAAAEKSEFDVELTSAGAPKVIKEGVEKAEDEDIKAKIEAEGGEVTLK